MEKIKYECLCGWSTELKPTDMLCPYCKEILKKVQFKHTPPTGDGDVETQVRTILFSAYLKGRDWNERSFDDWEKDNNVANSLMSTAQQGYLSPEQVKDFAVKLLERVAERLTTAYNEAHEILPYEDKQSITSTPFEDLLK